jgi:hypothetical protein
MSYPFTTAHIAVTVFVALLICVLVICGRYRDRTGIASADAFTVSLFCGTLAFFQLAVYMLVQSSSPRNTVVRMGKNIVNSLPDTKALLKSGAIDASTYDAKQAAIRSTNVQMLLASPAFLFAGATLAVAIGALITRFTMSRMVLRRAELKIVGVWTGIVVLNALLYIAFIKQHNYLYQTDLFGYCLKVLRKAAMGSVIDVASRDGSGVPSSSQTPQVTASLNSIISAYDNLHLETYTSPSVADRFKSAYNIPALVVISVSLSATGVAMYRLRSRGPTLVLCLVIVCSIFWSWLYAGLPSTLPMKSSLDDADALLYEVLN